MADQRVLSVLAFGIDAMHKSGKRTFDKTGFQSSGYRWETYVWKHFPDLREMGGADEV